MRKLTLLFAVLALVPAGLAVGCGGDDDDDEAAETGAELSGRIAADGSSTVGPLTTAAAERFQRENSGVQVTVGVSGTGGGFERFCAGETDLSNASRAIDDEEKQACDSKGIEYTELLVANDALTVVVNPQNDWADCLTVEQLKKIWDRGSKVNNWSQVDPQFPDERLRLFGAGTDSGTFDYFTDEINGEEGRSRSDYSATEDDNVTVEGVGGDKGAMGYFGLSYFQQNSDRLKALEIDGGSGCIAPSADTAQSGEYTPLSRPLFIYAKNESLQRPEVKSFLQYLLDNQQAIAESAQFVPLKDDQLQKSKDALSQAGGA
jgi:phosphate transport system substrate-binding protein